MNEQQYVETLFDKLDELNHDLLKQQQANNKLKKENRNLKNVIRGYKDKTQHKKKRKCGSKHREQLY